MRGFDLAFGVGHHAEHVPGGIEHARDLPRRAVDVAGVAERDAAFAFEPVERFGVGEVIAVVVRDRTKRAMSASSVRSMPPPPAVTVLLPLKLKQETAPKDPAGRSL